MQLLVTLVGCQDVPAQPLFTTSRIVMEAELLGGAGEAPGTTRRSKTPPLKVKPDASKPRWQPLGGRKLAFSLAPTAACGGLGRRSCSADLDWSGSGHGGRGGGGGSGGGKALRRCGGSDGQLLEAELAATELRFSIHGQLSDDTDVMMSQGSVTLSQAPPDGSTHTVKVRMYKRCGSDIGSLAGELVVELKLQPNRPCSRRFSTARCPIRREASSKASTAAGSAAAAAAAAGGGGGMSKCPSCGNLGLSITTSQAIPPGASTSSRSRSSGGPIQGRSLLGSLLFFWRKGKVAPHG